MKVKNAILCLCILFAAIVVACILLFPVEPIMAWAIIFFSSVFYGYLAFSVIKARKILLLPDSMTQATIAAKNVVKRWERTGKVHRYKTYYQLTFVTETHFRWTFDVSPELYNAVIEGDSGTLVYVESKRKRIYYRGFLRTR